MEMPSWNASWKELEIAGVSFKDWSEYHRNLRAEEERQRKQAETDATNFAVVAATS